jgi:hypothetical protein
VACGVPVAAYPVAGPRDVVTNRRSGVLDEDLARACEEALRLDRTTVRKHALQFTWSFATQQFLDNLCPARRSPASIGMRNFAAR